MNQPDLQIKLPIEFLPQWYETDQSLQALNRRNLSVRAVTKAKRLGYAGDWIDLVCKGESLAWVSMSQADKPLFDCVVTDADLQSFHTPSLVQKTVGSSQGAGSAEGFNGGSQKKHPSGAKNEGLALAGAEAEK